MLPNRSLTSGGQGNEHRHLESINLVQNRPKLLPVEKIFLFIFYIYLILDFGQNMAHFFVVDAYCFFKIKFSVRNPFSKCTASFYSLLF